MTPVETRQRLADWFSRWRVPLRRFLSTRAAIPRADVDDVAQEVFLRLMRYDRAEVVEHPQAYLFRMASNVASEWAIRSRLRHPHDSEWLTDLLSDDRPDEEHARRAAEQEIRAAIERLPVRQRQIVKLRFGEGLDQAAIAARLGLTERMVKRDLANCYATLRLELDETLLGVMVHGRE
jgi:RNA polymerase sigma factor (sigma-70 family)